MLYADAFLAPLPTATTPGTCTLLTSLSNPIPLDAQFTVVLPSPYVIADPAKVITTPSPLLSTAEAFLLTPSVTETRSQGPLEPLANGSVLLSENDGTIGSNSSTPSKKKTKKGKRKEETDLIAKIF